MNTINEYKNPTFTEKCATFLNKKFSPTTVKTAMVVATFFAIGLSIGVGVGIGVGIAALGGIPAVPLLLGGTFGFIGALVISTAISGITWGFFVEVLREMKDNKFAQKILKAENFKITAAKIKAVSLYSPHIRFIDFKDLKCDDTDLKIKLLKSAKKAKRVDFGLERDEEFLTLFDDRSLLKLGITLQGDKEEIEFIQELTKKCPELQQVTIRNCSVEALDALKNLNHLKIKVLDTKISPELFQELNNYRFKKLQFILDKPLKIKKKAYKDFKLNFKVKNTFHRPYQFQLKAR